MTNTNTDFCAGVDLAGAQNVFQGDIGNDGHDNDSPFVQIESCAVPVIASVNGACFTAGLELVLNCDFVVASAPGPDNPSSAIFCDTHVRYGIMPSGGASVKLPRLVGVNNAKMMVFMSKKVDAKTAHDWGLVNILVNDKSNKGNKHIDTDIASSKMSDDDLGVTIHPRLHAMDQTLKEAVRAARFIAKNGPSDEVLRGYKRVMRLGMGLSADEAHILEKQSAYQYYKSMPQHLFENMKKFKADSSKSTDSNNISARPRL